MHIRDHAATDYETTAAIYNALAPDRRSAPGRPLKAVALGAFDPHAIVCEVRPQTDQARAIRFVEDRGFDEMGRNHGVQTITTWNASGNEAIVALNDKLGFVRQPGTIYFRKTLEP